MVSSQSSCSTQAYSSSSVDTANKVSSNHGTSSTGSFAIYLSQSTTSNPGSVTTTTYPSLSVPKGFFTSFNGTTRNSGQPNSYVSSSEATNISAKSDFTADMVTTASTSPASILATTIPAKKEASYTVIFELYTGMSFITGPIIISTVLPNGTNLGAYNVVCPPRYEPFSRVYTVSPMIRAPLTISTILPSRTEPGIYNAVTLVSDFAL
jgi:hypothetical protein